MVLRLQGMQTVNKKSRTRTQCHNDSSLINKVVKKVFKFNCFPKILWTPVFTRRFNSLTPEF